VNPTSQNPSTFDEHWDRHQIDQVNKAKINEARAFLKPLWDFAAHTRGPLRILDVGCGDGVHAATIVRQHGGAHQYVGLDRALPAIAVARRRMSGEAGSSTCAFQVGDALALPFRSGSFDVAFSYGVLAYTGAVDQGIAELVRVCRPGGLVGLWVAPKRRGVAAALLGMVRGLCRSTGRTGSRLIVNAVVPFLFVLPVRSGVNLRTASWAECVEIVEVNLLPDLEFLTLDQILDSLQTRGVSVEFVDPDRPVAVWGCVA
jgi:ubiquinone/menaquinone biosynthesis C-methylase UbiE